MAIFYGFPVTNLRRKVPYFTKLQSMQVPLADRKKKTPVIQQGNGMSTLDRAKGFEKRTVYPTLRQLGL